MENLTQAESEMILAFRKSRERGADEHELVYDLVNACNKRARETGTNVFAVCPEVIREDVKLGQRFLAYVFDNSGSK